MRARALMVLGTSSHVGKSLLTVALCRIFAQEGYRVAPFKSQNMSLNSAATPEGLEIGRAQALQAEAAGIPPSVHMNPILLKPQGNMTSQIVVRGKIWGTLSAADYHQRRVQELLPLVAESYEHLAATHDLILLEGAGSPAEINLKQNDIVNMRMAELADAACLLAGDIDRGGVFASLLGTVELLEAHEQARIRGFLVNKFRGDRALLAPGITMIEQRMQIPCAGVIPWMPDLQLEEEDSAGLPALGTRWPSAESPDRPLRIAVIALPSFSNFTDFDSLRSEPSATVLLTQDPRLLESADVVILPGSKQTAADLAWLRRTGLAQAILAQAGRTLIAGICGGMQMLGHTLTDPSGIEHTDPVQGLDLLPLSTEMQPAKVTRITVGRTCIGRLFGQPIPPLPLHGYEIHVGRTTLLPQTQAFATVNLETGPIPEGCISPDTLIFGTYLHGLFDSDPFRHAFLQSARKFHGLNPASHCEDWQRKRTQSLDRLADTVRANLDLPLLKSWLGLP